MQLLASSPPSEHHQLVALVYKEVWGKCFLASSWAQVKCRGCYCYKFRNPLSAYHSPKVKYFRTILPSAVVKRGECSVLWLLKTQAARKMKLAWVSTALPPPVPPCDTCSTSLSTFLFCTLPYVSQAKGWWSVVAHLPGLSVSTERANGGERLPQHGSNDTHPGISNEPIWTTIPFMPLL